AIRLEFWGEKSNSGSMKLDKEGKTFNKRSGSSTLELLIAFAVLTLMVTAVIMLSFGNQSIGVDIETNTEALAKTEKLLEDARAASRTDFNSINNFSSTEKSSSLTYTKNLTVTEPDFYSKKV